MNNIEWLKKESRKWVEENIITAEQQELLSIRYPQNKAGNQLILFFAVIGALLIGAGIILVFATNWWKLPVAVKIMIAFLPLLAAQAVGVYTYKRKQDSPAFKEGGSVFLSLAFFAALALIGQAFHTPSDLESYILVCILFTLPAVYLFRAKAALTIYIAGALYIGWSMPLFINIVLLLAVLPFFYLETVKTEHKGMLNYLLLLLSCMVTNTTIAATVRQYNADVSALEIALACGLIFLLLDLLFRRFGRIYFFTSAKLLGILCIAVTLLVCAWDFSFDDDNSILGFVFIAVVAAVYLVLRCLAFTGVASADLFAAAALILMLCTVVAGVAANLLLLALGVYYVVLGSKTLALRQLNFGMVFLISVISIRFFDSSLDLLGRGIVFILLGAMFLAVNLYISRKRKGQPQ